MRRLSSVAIAAVLLAFSAQAVSADALAADGDGLAPVANGRLDLGTMCHAAETTATVLVAVSATGHPNGGQVFDNGALVETSAEVVAGSDLSVSSLAPALVMAADWRAQPNGTVSNHAPWDVAVTPTTLGRYRATVEFSATGLNRRGEQISRVRRMNVVGRVVDCAPPVIAGVPADLVVEAVAPDGADVDFTVPTAADAVDGAVGVSCDLAPGSRVPLGPTVVTCTAADDAGNARSATFDIMVVDTTAPTLEGMPSDVFGTATDEDGLIVDWPMPTATDAVDGSVPVACDPPATGTFAVGSTSVTCSATDTAGNIATAAFTVEVADPPDPESALESPPVPDADPQTDADTDPQTDVRTVDPVQEPSTDEATASASDGPAAAGSVLPDTSMSLPGRAMPTLGVLLLALAGVATRRRTRAA
jgi:HYR domain